MTTAKINNQHDYITLRIKFADKTTLNLTRSFSGTKVSGTRATRDGLNFFDAYLKAQKGRNLLEIMQELRDTAEKSTDIATFLKGIRLPCVS
jgi:hypothetical protein